MSGVLIVDDMAFFRRSLRELISGWGWPVAGEAADGAEAVRLYEALRPGLVIMDLHMPGRDGFQALEEIRRIDRAARVVVCSVDSRAETVARAVRLGACDFVAKPVAEDRLFRAVEAVLGPPAPGARRGGGAAAMREGGIG